jgi:2Fe-2S ferredoxin
MTSTQETVRCEADGFDFEAETGASLMLALNGTCHVQLREGWASRLPAPGEDEVAMLASLPGATPTSRLSCQIRVTPELAGLSLDIPR